MSNIKCTAWTTNNHYLVCYWYGHWHTFDPNGEEWRWANCCHAQRGANRRAEGYLTEPACWLDKVWYDELMEALTDAYQQSGQLAHLMNQREVKGSVGSNS